MDEVENLKKQWDDTFKTVVEKINSITNGKYSEQEQIIKTQNKESLLRMKAIVQDGLSLLNSLIFMLDLFAPQLPNDDQVEVAKALLESWQNLSKSLRQNFRDASLQANENIRKAAQKEVMKLNFVSLTKTSQILGPRPSLLGMPSTW